MKHVRMIALVALGMSVSGCASLDVTTRNVPFEAPSAEAVAPSMKVTGYEVRVPQTLRVSEANLYYPLGDIVWRGDPLGERHEQVKAILDESLARALKGTNSDGKVPVLVDIELRKFHALSEKARYTIGGRHEIIFMMNFLDPKTREPVAEPRRVDATFKAFGGQRAIAAERNGITQKKRIEDHLVEVFQRELGLGADAPAAKPAQPDMVSQNRTDGLNGALKGPLKAGDRTAGLF